MGISAKVLAQQCGCTVQAINKAKRKAESASGKNFGRPDPKDKRVILFLESEVAEILKYAPRGQQNFRNDSETSFRNDSETVSEGEFVSEIFPGGMHEDSAPGSLMLVRPGSLGNIAGASAAMAPAVFADTQVIDTRTALLNQASAHNVGQLENFLDAYTDASVQGAIVEIDHTVAALKASALNKAISNLGKPSQGAPQQVSKQESRKK